MPPNRPKMISLKLKKPFGTDSHESHWVAVYGLNLARYHLYLRAHTESKYTDNMYM